MGKEVQMDKYFVRVRRVKERKKLKSGEKVYERYRGYVEFKENDAKYEWVAIRRRDLETIEGVLIHLDNLLEKELTFVISPDDFPALYDALKEYEEKHKDAWVEDYGIPRIYYQFFKKMFFPEWASRIELYDYLKDEGIDVDGYALEDDIAKLWDILEETIYREYGNLDIKEVLNLEALDYGEICIDMDFGNFIVSKRGIMYLEKEGEVYKLKVKISGSCDIDEISIR